MKKLLVVFAACGIVLACNNPVAEKIKETRQNVKNTKNAVEEMKDMQKDLEKLKNETPLTNDELKAWLPDEVLGMQRISFKAGQTAFMKIASIEATYANEDKSKTFKVQVIDGAGEMGAAATAGMRILFSQDFEEETENSSKRTVKKDGVKAVEEYWKNNNNSSIQFMQDDRFYIKADGKNMDLDETWNAVEELGADDLG
ncbi:MAG TPA: hypothetical protein PKW08_09155 [Flavobacteriaceae bacterium]|nr:hypothetical protein [Flavobacteriaceae bacterium]MCB9212184.1 hypothetical protein [Alteromonas sp.]HPF10438.1 hypothetical protein [Flavobacteriaceae bacterium]HQU21747.1 hypothetical protein [Flavobacteriaceae bacterium]HQU64649.1 hypothetical protein [Flavobacteriaceae bacterium]